LILFVGFFKIILTLFCMKKPTKTVALKLEYDQKQNILFSQFILMR